MNLGDLILEVLEKCVDVIFLIYYQDYTALSKQIMGVSIVDIIGIVMAAYLLMHFIKIFLNGFGDTVRGLFQFLMRKGFSLFSFAVRNFYIRIKNTVFYLWGFYFDAVRQ